MIYTERPKYRGYLKLLILHLLEEKPLHGYGIMTELKKRYEIPSPSAGAIYPLLSSLKRKNLIEVVETEKREKKLYKITEKGKSYLNEHQNELKDVLEKVERFREFSRLGGRELFKTIKEVMESLPSLSASQKAEISKEIENFTKRIKLILIGGR